MTVTSGPDRAQSRQVFEAVHAAVHGDYLVGIHLSRSALPDPRGVLDRVKRVPLSSGDEYGLSPCDATTGVGHFGSNVNHVAAPEVERSGVLVGLCQDHP